MRLPALTDYAFLLSPSDPDHSFHVHELDESWSLRGLDPSDADVVVVGRVPFRSASSLPRAIRGLVARERFKRRIRRHPPRGYAVETIHRLKPPPGRAGRVASRTRDVLMGGLVVRLARREGTESLFDAVLNASGLRDAGAFEAGSDKAATVGGSSPEGEPVVLRMAPAGTASDPARAADALEYLAGQKVDLVPRVAARGKTRGVSWALETRLGGRRPRRVDDSLLEQVVGFLSVLPQTGSPPRAFRADLATVVDRVPGVGDWASGVEERIGSEVADLPGVLRHGDLWAGNVLVRGGSLVGVIDWDGWDPAGVPGTDLVHLFVARARARGGGTVGDAWRLRVWAGPDFVRLTAPYWARLRIEPGPRLLDAVGGAWWVAWLAQAVTRHPRYLDDPRWLHSNVEEVVAAILS